MDACRARASGDRLSLLSSAETALVLQPLDNASRRAAAVTCRRMLADALQPLAWKHAECVRVTAQQLQQRVAPPAAHSLLQLAPVQLDASWHPVQPALLDRVRRLCSLRSKHGSHDQAALLALLQHPATQQQLRQVELRANTLTRMWLLHSRRCRG